MKRFNQILSGGLLLVLIMFAGGCSGAPAAPAGEPGAAVSLWVTRDFGAEALFHADLEIRANQSVLALLHEHLEVETEYGGGFVNAIEGLESGYSSEAGASRQMVDWFFYVNGILSGQGAAEYVPVAGDVIWWDYRPWGDISFTPAVVGAFPQPFSGGYRGNNPGTLILAGEGCSEPAEKLARFLEERGAVAVEVAPYREADAVSRSKIVLVVAPWSQLYQSPFWEGIQQHRDRTGWFAELTAQRFYPLDLNAQRQGEGYGEGEKTGAVLATGTGLGDPYPLWLVTAVDREGLDGAVKALVDCPECFEKAVGALIVDGEVLGLPLKDE